MLPSEYPLDRSQEALLLPAVKVALQMHSKHKLTGAELRALADYLHTAKANNEQHLTQIAGAAAKRLKAVR